MARVLDGAFNQINYGDVLDATLFTDYSIAVRFVVDVFDTSWQTLFSKGDGSWRISRNDANNTMTVAAGRFPTEITVASTTTVNDGNPYLIMLTWDDSITEIEQFINGSSEGTSSTGTVPINVTHNVAIGENIEPNSREWEGKISEVIFNSVKYTANQILSLNSGVNPFVVADQTVEFYAPLYGNESPESDYAGQVNKGTLEGTPAKFAHPQVELLENYV